VLHAHQQVQHRGRARPPQEARPVPRRRADGPNQLWSWDITYLPTSVRGIWLYLYLVVDVWSRKIVAWDVHEREDAQLAADLISRACIRERISKQRQRRLILHADNGSAMRAATLEVRLEELGVLRSFSRPRVSNDNPYSEALFRTAKYRPDYPSRPFTSKEEACQWAAAFVHWYVHEHRHSAIRFVTPQQRQTVRPRPSATSARWSMSRPESAIPGVGHDPCAAGNNPPLSGSMNRLMTQQPRRSYSFIRWPE
jgi:putative transposase